ncbi:hypothetical protein ACFLRF_03240, partial [Candidatus Altiarchaeota archaeon]
ALVGGILLGVLHLTKAGSTPLLLTFIIVCVIKILYLLVREGRRSSKVLKTMIAISLVLTSFLTVIGPYIIESKTHWDSYFHNVNYRLFFLEDDKDCAKTVRKYGTKFSPQDMPEERIPGPIKYYKEHSLEQIMDRFYQGGSRAINEIVESYGHHKYLIFFTLFFIFSVLVDGRNFCLQLKTYAFPCIFITLLVLVNFAVISWWSVISTITRHFLAIFPPIIFSLSYGTFMTNKKAGIINKKFDLTINILLLAYIFFDIYMVLTERIITAFGGA